MGLRASTHATDRVVVVLRAMREGQRGRLVPVEYARVACFGRMQELTSADVEAYAAAGESGVLHLRKFHTRSFPGDDVSQILDAHGVLWEVVGEPQRRRGSRGTARDIVTIRQAGVRRVTSGEGV